MSFRAMAEDAQKERELYEYHDAVIRKGHAAYERERDLETLAEIAEWRRVTGKRPTGNQRVDEDACGNEIRRAMTAHARLGRKVPIMIVQLERIRLGRDLTLLEMWQCLQPTERDLAAGWVLPEEGASVRDVLPGCDVRQRETADESRQRQLDDWRNWHPEA